MTTTFDQNGFAAGYVEKVKNYYGNVSYYCNLCGLQFSEKLMGLHCKGKSHENYLKAVQERDAEADKILNAKHDELLPSKEEFDNIVKIVLDCEESLKLASDDIYNSDQQQNGKASDGSEIKMEEDEAQQMQQIRSVFGAVRVGFLAKGLLMRNDSAVQLVALSSIKPTVKLLNQISQLLQEKLQLVNENSYEVETVTDEACVIVRAKKNNATCKISLTSSLVRPHPFEYYNAQLPEDPPGMPSFDHCIEALKEMRRARWFEAKVYCHQYSGLVLRVLRDLCAHDPHWRALDFWILENLVERCLSVAESQLSPSLALRSVMEMIASGFLIGDSPGVYDQCERQPQDLLSGVETQLLEHITRKAQEAVRLIAFGQIDQLLSHRFSQFDATKSTPGGVLKRSGNGMAENTTDSGKKKR